MDAKAFFFLVERMRAKQKEYFKTRTSASLSESKVRGNLFKSYMTHLSSFSRAINSGMYF